MTMAATVAPAVALVHQDRLQMRPVAAKADLKNLQKHTQWQQDGSAMAAACSLARLTRKEAAARLDVGENQLGAWIAGAERPQTERFERDTLLSGPMAVAKAMQHPEVFDVRWTITAKVTA
jgi:hypothetical protein